VLSAIVPTAIAQRFFQPEAVDERDPPRHVPTIAPAADLQAEVT
jgi:hypothetical protein